MDIRSIKKLSKYIHEKSLPALVHSKFNEPVWGTRRSRVLAIVALDLD